MSKKREAYIEEDEYVQAPEKKTSAINPTMIKGTIAIMLTALFVTIVSMLFAKSLFVSSATDEKKTGSLTAPPNYTTISTTTSATTTTKATTTRDKNTDRYQEEIQKSGVTEMVVKSAVYMRSAPNSDSEKLMTLPTGAKVTAYSVTNGNWLYIEYNGKTGYAYGDFFTGDRPGEAAAE
ncbi:MAG: SH3 domain-containing protein [Ruminococcus sp.]|nr:SH3 domain-containing protein [Ruminococcus sp.]